MKHYHYFVESTGIPDATTIVYSVAIGASKQANRDFLYLTAYAVETGSYFKIRSLESSQFIQRLREAHGIPSSNFVLLDSRELVRHLKANTRPQLSADTLANRHYMMQFLSTNYLISNRMAAAKAKPSAKRHTF